MLESIDIAKGLPLFGLAVAAYLFGSISTAIVCCKLMGLPDPRGLGSGNPGATNVLRTGSKKAAIITLLGDALKGLIPVLVTMQLFPDYPAWSYALVGFAAFLGHLYPIYYSFAGGKGVATALGVLLAYCWSVFLAVVATWLLVAWVFRYSALAALTGFALAPIYLLFFGGGALDTIIISVMSAFIFWRHRTNIDRLCSGKEPKIGNKA